MATVLDLRLNTLVQKHEIGGRLYGEHRSVEIERVASAIVDSAYKVHLTLGPCLLETVPVTCLAQELKLRGLTVWREVPVPIVDEGLKLESGMIDLRVNGVVVVEAKAVQEVQPVFMFQLLTHLKFADERLGFLINFDVQFIKDAIRRVANELPCPLCLFVPSCLGERINAHPGN